MTSISKSPITKNVGAKNPVVTFFQQPIVGRLLACLALGVVLAIIIGPQEGNFQDIGLAFRQAVFSPRVFIFLAIGILVFLAITFWPSVVPFLVRPGVRPLLIGVISLIAAHSLLNWYDQLGKFGPLSDAVKKSPGVSSITTSYFGWLSWGLIIASLVVCGVGIILGVRVLGWVTVAIALFGIYATYTAHSDVLKVGKAVDHSLGSGATIVAYLAVIAAAVTVALSRSQVADSKAFADKLMGFRPGLPLAALGVVVGAVGLGSATWFSPLAKNATLTDTATMLKGKGLAPVAAAYLSWLGWALFAVTVVLALAATYLRNRMLGWVTAGVGLVSMLITVYVLYLISSLGATLKLDASTGPWQNLGAGGWMGAATFLLLAGAGYIVASAGTVKLPSVVRRSKSSDAVGGGFLKSPGGAKTLFVVAAAAALFYPPTANGFWQNVLVTEIGVYVLLAVGLNVVVGWAGLLDLGFIGFYAIGSYTTAYLVGSLPVKPPSWLHMSPLLAIPFAILLCVVAGVLLGAPTLRLRGDYLAIVTLGFGEIIRIAAVNSDGLTNSTRGPSPTVPHPVINLGFFKITWGQNYLQYWYLLLFLVVVVVLLFRRLENSRVGRSWAAIREDEIAAQATGINTTRVKLMAFAIGASTSGLAGVFFASQVGYFNPDNFVLNNSILVVAYVVFGGMGSLPGAIAGAAVLTWLPEFLKDQVPAEDRQIWIGLIVLLMMIFRPGGLIPARRRQAELKGLQGGDSSEVSAVPEGEGMGVKA